MSSEWIETITRIAQVAGGRLVIRSALNPLLWLCAIVCPTCWAAAYLLRTDVLALRFLVGLSSLPILTTCSVSIYFSVRKPDGLQPEEFLIRQQTLQLLQRKGRRVPVDPKLLAKVLKPFQDHPSDRHEG